MKQTNRFVPCAQVMIIIWNLFKVKLIRNAEITTRFNGVKLLKTSQEAHCIWPTSTLNRPITIKKAVSRGRFLVKIWYLIKNYHLNDMFFYVASARIFGWSGRAYCSLLTIYTSPEGTWKISNVKEKLMQIIINENV